jgi:hypothetical protein
MNPNKTQEIDALTRDYFDEIVRAKEIETHAFDRLISMTTHDPSAAWELVKRLVAMSTSDTELSLVGSGPMEELLVRHPLAYVECVIAEACQNERFRRALDFVVIGDGDIPKQWLDRLERAQEKWRRPPVISRQGATS